MLRRSSLAILLVALLGRPLGAQDARVGVAVPLTVAGQALRTGRAEAIDADAVPWSAAFRATAYPSLKLGDRWYVYSAVQLNSEPYFFYESYYPDREVEARVLQAFLGYAWTGERKALGAKIGKLSSAFGSFPLRYDETDNPLLDQPLGYSAYLHIRPDALPCGVRDLPNLRSYTEYSGVRFYCGGQMTLAGERSSTVAELITNIGATNQLRDDIRGLMLGKGAGV